MKERRPASGSGRPSSQRAIALATVVTVLTSLPMFLVGALSIPLRADLAFGPAALGGAIGIFRASGALAARPLGSVTDRIGATRAMRIAIMTSVAGSLAIAGLAHSWATLAVGLSLCGASAAFAQTAANRYLIRHVRDHRQGLAFGIKQSSLPTGAMLAGIMVPVLGLTLGWRAAFVSGALFGVVVLLVLPGARKVGPPAASMGQERPTPSARQGLVVVTVAMAFGMAAASTLAAFTVESAVDAGFSLTAAAGILTFGSGCAIVCRVVVGAVSDQMRSGHLQLVAMMLVAGSLGYSLLGIGRPWTLWTGTVLAFALGWGFNGLFWFAIVRLYRDAPGATTGLVMPGGMFGGVVGPIVFGAIAERADFSTAWFAMAGSGLISAALMTWGRKLLLNDRSR